MTIDSRAAALSEQIWRSKYRLVDGTGAEANLDETWRRTARALAAADRDRGADWEERFFHTLRDFRFLPGGRILAGAGSARAVTLFNCFVMGTLEDSVPGIFRALQESAITMQRGGGIGLDFSTLRPQGSEARAAGTIASGPVSFMEVWDAMCGTILSSGARRGAMMATLRCDHPDIVEFVTAKQQGRRLPRFNLSVQVTDAFLAAVRAGKDWPLVFPAEAADADGPLVLRDWPGSQTSVQCRVVRSMPARDLWQLILRGAYDYAEPGVLFIDRINYLNNLAYKERITATNPCGEVPLPPYGACDLGSINLARFVSSPFTAEANLDRNAIAKTVRIAVRLLDNVVDVSSFPLRQQQTQAKATRRIGLGITGLADALVMLRLNYGDPAGRTLASETMQSIRDTAYRTSVQLAREKGPFPDFDPDKLLTAPFVAALPDDIRAGITEYGIRNSHLIAIAPTGTISLLAGNVSSGIEPVFAASYRRSILDETGTPQDFQLTDYAVALWRNQNGSGSGLPDEFVTAGDLDIEAHLDMQAALQPFVDNSISKTINVPQDIPFEQFHRTYDLAYDKGLKGCTVFRPNPNTGTVLGESGDGSEGRHCCVLEREAD
jgi:ribonucleoside-diphosphate reductase alpha chain